MPENEEIMRLWMMPKKEFNNWRRQNDLPRLLSFFKNSLPHFQDWQNSYGIDDNKFLAIDRTSRFFIGEKDLYFCVGVGPGEDGQNEEQTFINDLPKEEAIERQKKEIGSIIWTITTSIKFQPYFYWLKKKKRARLFLTPGDRNHSVANDFEYRSWRGGNPLTSQAYLFYNHPVLKLGGVTVTPNQLDERNLDFVDLDGLTITRTGATRSTYVGYSSCRNIRFIKTKKSFFYFEKCHIENLLVAQSSIQDLHFISSSLMTTIFKDSKFLMSGFKKTFPGQLDIQNCDLQYFYFVEPPKNMTFASISDFYRRLRTVFQQKGDRREVSRYYYLERWYELLSHLCPFVPFSAIFPSPAYIGGYRDLFDRWRIGQYTTKVALKLIWGNLISRLKLLLPHYFFRLVKNKVQLLSQTFDWLIWGFGERPGYVFGWIGLVISLFTARYYFGFLGATDLKHNFLESFYCSTFNFSTIGCNHAKTIDAFEGLSGALLVGILVAGFSNRTRY